jgi:hypothetical protein
MTRARSLSQLANSNVFSVDANNSRVGIGSTIPDVKLDVGGDLYADNLTINNLIGVAATFSGVVSYEDVTNVDSVGLGTFRNGLHVTGGSVGIGTTNPSDKLTIWSAPNSLFFGGKDTIRGNNVFQLLADDASGNGELRLYRNSGSDTHEKTVEIASQGNSYFIGGNVGIGTNNPASILHLLGTAPRITLTDTAGTDDVGKIFSTGGALFLQHRDGAGHGEIILRTENSSTAVERLRITSDGKVRVPDSGRFTCGTDDDLALRHSGTTGVLENNTGHFYIDQNTDDSDIYLRSDNGSGDVTNYVICDGGSGAVILNHYGSEKFTTTSSGVEVTGTVSDSIGPLRRLGANTQSGAYTLVAGDAGKYVAQATNSASVTVPNGVFSAGDMVTIVNLTATNINITQGAGLDLNFTADGTTGTRTLGAKGACTILFVSSGTSFISGSGLS